MQKEKQMKYRLFFADYCEEKHLDADNACDATVPEILHSMDCVLHRPGNYLGIIDANDSTLQFMVNDDRSIHFDIPSPDKGGSFVKTTTLEECLSAVRELKGEILEDDFEGMEFRPW